MNISTNEYHKHMQSIIYYRMYNATYEIQDCRYVLNLYLVYCINNVLHLYVHDVMKQRRSRAIKISVEIPEKVPRGTICSQQMSGNNNTQ